MEKGKGGGASQHQRSYFTKEEKRKDFSSFSILGYIKGELPSISGLVVGV